jgi:putative nucleotidyltransferase with HDIG domain
MTQRVSILHAQACDELTNSLKKIRRGLEEAVKTLASVIEKRDPYTSGHQQRVTRLACSIAQELGLPHDRIDGLYLAGILHDIGKISVPSEILSRPVKLAKVEYDLIKIHPRVGYEIMQSIEFPWQIDQMIYQHHERMDGSGYPQGLKGDAIILEARILAVADVVEAMSSHRPYRPALGIDAALQELTDNPDKYDKRVAEACRKLFKEKAFTFD